MKVWTAMLKGNFKDDRRKLTTPGELHVVMSGQEVTSGRGNPGVEESAPLVAHLALGVQITSPDEDNFEFVTTLAECERAGIPVSTAPSEFQTSAPGASIVGDMAFFNAGLERAAALAEDVNSHGAFIAEMIRDLVVPGAEIDALPKLDDRASYSAQAVRRHVAAALAAVRLDVAAREAVTPTFGGMVAKMTASEISALHEWSKDQLGSVGHVDLSRWPGWSTGSDLLDLALGNANESHTINPFSEADETEVVDRMMAFVPASDGPKPTSSLQSILNTWDIVGFERINTLVSKRGFTLKVWQDRYGKGIWAVCTPLPYHGEEICEASSDGDLDMIPAMEYVLSTDWLPIVTGSDLAKALSALEERLGAFSDAAFAEGSCWSKAVWDALEHFRDVRRSGSNFGTLPTTLSRTE